MAEFGALGEGVGFHGWPSLAPVPTAGTQVDTDLIQHVSGHGEMRHNTTKESLPVLLLRQHLGA